MADGFRDEIVSLRICTVNKLFPNTCSFSTFFYEKNKFKEIQNWRSEIADPRWRTILCILRFNDVSDDVSYNQSVSSIWWKVNMFWKHWWEIVSITQSKKSM